MVAPPDAGAARAMTTAPAPGGRALAVLKIAWRVVTAVAFIAYPLLVYAGLAAWSPRWAALGLLALFLPAAIGRLRKMNKGALRALALVPVVTVLALGAAAALNAAGLVLAVPIAINALLLAAFGATLFRPPPMIERFARLQVDDLSADELAWCRAWTVGWCAFFVVNGTIAGVLAAAGELQPWALYNGLISYVLMGMMLSFE
ncbi:MAG: hypothetical protein KC635_05045, partial [Myxococcales bacterium]|nr:hypothetical protein [Myxococcales bacterium]